MPKVSILIPCFNAERWIRQAIQSALEQTYPDTEVLVIDDGSTDGSLDIIKGFGDSIRWESGPNRGGNAARNRLLELSNGDWLQYLDADDYLMPDKVQQQVSFLESRSEIDVVFGPSTLEHCSDQGTSRETLPIPEPHDVWILLARWYLPQTGAPLWRKAALVDIGGWNPDQAACQEHELYLRLLKRGKRFEFCPHGGAVYRQWGEHTVCKRDKPAVRKLRLKIEQELEDHLRATNQLTPERLWAINMARFELARMAWLDEKEEAERIFQSVLHSQEDFLPFGAAAPPMYRAVFRRLGFRSAERLAFVRRSLKQFLGII